MTLSPRYTYGHVIPTPDYPDSAREALDMLSVARADFGICHKCYDMTYGTSADHENRRRVAMFAIGGICNEILDDSNESALQSLAESWGYDAHVHSGVGTVVCVDPAEVDLDTLADMISTAEGFADYPVFDESDYSERENAAFVECFAWESRMVPHEPTLDAEHPAYSAALAHAMSNYYGHSDSGHISREHVVQSWRAAGVDIPA